MLKNIVNFFFEIETLKNIKRSGSNIARIKDPDSVAEHTAIASQIAFIIAHLENANAEKCACMTLFHDNAEIRIGDLNKIQTRYLDKKNAEKKAFLDQIKDLPNTAQLSIYGYFTELNEQKTKEAKTCRDADLLELAFQSKIFLEQGFLAKQNWLDNIEKSLNTKSAQALFQELLLTSSDEWWDGLKNI